MYNNVGNTNNNNPSGGIRLNFITTADQTKFEDLFKRATASTGGKQINAAAVRDLLTRSRLDNDSLAKIWDLASIAKAPYLTFPEFAVAMYLTSTKLTGKPIPNQLPSEVREETEIAMATLASTETNSTSHLVNTNTPPIQPSTTGYPQSQIAMMTGMVPQYQQQHPQQQQHQQLQPQMPMMTGFQQPQQLPMMTGVSSPQPQMPMRTGIPMQPYQHQQQTPMHTGYMSQAPLQAPMATGIGRPIQTGANKPRLENMDFANKMMPNQSSRQNLLAPVLGTHQQHAISWKISPEEKQRYREIFAAWENSGTGYLSGEMARQVFMQSGLQENDLMKIWNLADKENRGSLDVDEFAIAMHLVYRKLNNFDIPSVLPAELAPPSSVLKKFVIGHQSAPSPFSPSSSANAAQPDSTYQQRDRNVDHDDAYVSSARHKGPSRFMNSAPSRRMSSYDSDREDQDDYDSAAVDELRLQIATTKKKLDGLTKQQGTRQYESTSSSNLYSMEELKENIRKTQDQLGLAYRENGMTSKYFQNTETLLDLLETQKSLQDEIQYLCNRDIPVLARQLRSSAAELRDAKVRYGRKNDGGQDYTAYIQPTGPGGATTESDRVRAKAKAMMAARKIGTSSSRDADYELRRAEDEKQTYDRLADDAERDMERNRSALRDIRGDLRYLDQLVESSSVLDKKRFEKGQDMSYELRRFIEQLEREAPLGFSPPSSPAVNRRGVLSSHSEIGSTSSPSLDSPASAPSSSPSSTRVVSKPRTADEIKKEAERRVQERLDALRAKRGQNSPATRSPQSTPKIDHEEQAAQQRLREAEQLAQAKLRESEKRQEDRTPARDYELEQQRNDERRQQEEMDRQRQLDEEREAELRRQEDDRQRQLDEEKDMEERRRAILQKEEEQRVARLEALRKAEEEEEAAKNTTNIHSEASIPPPPPPPPPATIDQTSTASPPVPAPPPAPTSTSDMDTIDEKQTSATSTEPSKGSSNNPFAKLQQQPAPEQNEKSVEEPAKTTAADKRVSYNPFAAFSAFSATKGHDSDDDSEDDDGWDVVNQDDSDNDDDFPAAGSAKNLAGKLFDAMSQRQAGGSSPKPFASPSPQAAASPAHSPAAPAADVPPPPPPPPPPAGTSDIPPPPPAPTAVSSDIPPPPAPPQPASNNDFSPPQGRSALLGQIQQGTRLKKTVTNDRSQASVSGQVLDSNNASTKSESTVPTSAPAPNVPAPDQPSGPLASDGFLAELQKRTGVNTQPDTAPPAISVDSTDSEGTEYIALWDYDGQGADDLSFQADDVIMVNNGLESDDWWYGTSKRSKQSGYFPRNYVENKVGGANSAQVSKGIALYDYTGPEDEGCLTFEAGASLVILDKSLGDWWTAKLENGKQGLVPANYVEDQE